MMNGYPPEWDKREEIQEPPHSPVRNDVPPPRRGRSWVS